MEAVIVVGGAVVVMVGIAEEVGRTGRTAEAELDEVGLGVVVEEEEEGEEMRDEVAVAVAITDVTAVKVDTDVATFVLEVDRDGNGAGTVGRGAFVVDDAALGVLEGGEAVTTGWTVVMAVELTTQTMLAHV